MVTASRKNQLASEYGDPNKCLTQDAWLPAIINDLNDVFRVYPDDMLFLLDETTFCAEESTTPTPSDKATVLIDTGGLKANVWIDRVNVGTTDVIFELAPGTYTAELKKDGYQTRTIAIIAKEGYALNPRFTLIPTSSPAGEEVGPVTDGTPKLVMTGNTKGLKPPSLGEVNWFGVEFVNQGDATWRGYLGFKLTDEGGQIFKYEGNPTYVQNVQAGETKYIWASTLIPADSLQEGSVLVSALIYKV